MRLSRRALLGAAAAGSLLAAWGWRSRPERFAFVAMAEPAGFRRIGGGAVSGGFDPLFGLGGGPGVPPADLAAVRADPCAALFGPVAAGTVPVASFSDYNCPYCRVLTAELAAIAEADPAVAVTWHEWPVLGETSVLAARGALAAEQQGAYPALHARLMRAGFVPTPAYLVAIAEEVGLDPVRFAADMEGPEVAARIARAHALAELFRFGGTPALVVGRTVVNGAIEPGRLRALIVLERSEGRPPACRP